MFHQLRDIYGQLSADQQRKLLWLQVLVILMSILEVASVMAIGPFMALVGDRAQLAGDGNLAAIYRLSGIASSGEFLVALGILALTALALAAAISSITIWKLSMYGNRVGADLGIRLYRHYMRQPLLFHVANNSSQLTNKIARECNRLTGGIINPVLQLNARLVMALAMAVAIIIYNPVVALVGIGVFTGAYWVLYNTVRRQLSRHGRAITEQEELRFKLMSEGFGGIKDVMLLGRQAYFTERFSNASREVGLSAGRIQVLSLVPRYGVELIAFGTIIFLVLYLLVSHNGNLGEILPVLSIYAIAGFKLLPAFQQIYSNLSLIRGNLAAWENIRADFVESKAAESRAVIHSTEEHLAPERDIALVDVHFRYPGAAQAALNGLDIRIPAHSVVGLVGPSGSGKSTTVDILLGLLQPDRGELRIDGAPLDGTRLRAWQNSVGFVAQSIYLADASIRDNIAFGLPTDQIDDAKVRRALTLAHLDELVATLPGGIDTPVGERGIQLSGGQRQRVGIARALYHDADVLIFDEATSALDGVTEKMIMDAIHDFSGTKTIVLIAHRLATVRKCQCIYILDDGRVVDCGGYDDLSERNPLFRALGGNS